MESLEGRAAVITRAELDAIRALVCAGGSWSVHGPCARPVQSADPCMVSTRSCLLAGQPEPSRFAA